MNVNADTTNEAILANVAAARVRLANLATNVHPEIEDYEALGKAANAVATAQGEASVRLFARDLLAGGVSNPRLVMAEYVLDLVGHDTWSGRGNDARRSFIDGAKAAANELRYSLSRG